MTLDERHSHQSSGFFPRSARGHEPSKGRRARIIGSLPGATVATALVETLRLVREDLMAHDGDWARPGFQALLVYRFSVWRMSIRPRALRLPFSAFSRLSFAIVRNLYGIELPHTARIGRRVVFEHQHGIVVHGNSVIGDDCIIRHGVTLGIRRLDRPADAPVLGRGINVGAGAKILGAVRVGDHAEIGANAVVLDDVPAHTLAVGVPACHVTRPRQRAARREPGAPGVELAGAALAATPAPSSSVAQPGASRPRSG